MTKKVKCCDCGFLCDRDALIRLYSGSEKIFEEDEAFSVEKGSKLIKGIFQDMRIEADIHREREKCRAVECCPPVVNKFFWCYKEILDLKKFISIGDTVHLGKPMTLRDASNPRKCNKFSLYRQGLSSEDHIQLEIEEKRNKNTLIIAIIAILLSLFSILWNIYAYLK